MVRLLVLGATGGLGKALTRQAAESYEVTAFVRDVNKAAELATIPNVTVVSGDASSEDDVFNAIQGQDVVISAVGGFDKLLALNTNIIAQAEKAGVKRLYLTGGAGCLNLPDGSLLADSPNFPVLFRKASKEIHLISLERLQNTSLDWTFTAPARMLPGERTKQFRVSIDVAIPEALAGVTSYEDVADAIISTIDKPEYFKHKIGVAGPAKQ